MIAPATKYSLGARCAVPGCGGEITTRTGDIGRSVHYCLRCEDRVAKMALVESARRGTLSRIEGLVTSVQERMDLVARLNEVTAERDLYFFKVRDLKQTIEDLSAQLARAKARPAAAPGLSLREQVLALLPRAERDAISLAEIAVRCSPQPNLSTLRRRVLDVLVQEGAAQCKKQEQHERRGPREIYVYWLVEDGRGA